MLQDAILGSAAERGYREITTKQRVALAGLSRGAFYKPCESKEANAGASASSGQPGVWNVDDGGE